MVEGFSWVNRCLKGKELNFLTWPMDHGLALMISLRDDPAIHEIVMQMLTCYLAWFYGDDDPPCSSLAYFKDRLFSAYGAACRFLCVTPCYWSVDIMHGSTYSYCMI